MIKNKSISPIVKWVGGKRQLLPEIVKRIPNTFSYYAEPFVGGGAVFFELQPKKAIINDLNIELINLYKVIKYNVEELISDLSNHKNEKEYFYEIRKMDRDEGLYKKLSNVEKASRLLYLNKTCYNGLYRVNSKGQFNTPFGSYKNPNFNNKELLRELNKYFNDSQIEFYSEDYSMILNRLDSNSFVYLDPPYDPVSETSNFTSYSKTGFGQEEQIRLKEHCDQLNDQGIKFLLSNSSTPFIMDLYGNYHIDIVYARRSVNSNAQKRGEVGEVLVTNYDYTI